MSSDNGTVLDVIELTKVFRDFWGRESVRALDGLSFEVRRGEVFGLLGPNGSGKTTAVRVILGLLFPTRGAVRLFGKSPHSIEVKKRIGYMPEESHLYSYLNAEETLDFFGRLFRLPAAERHRRADALIQMVGLNRARRRPIGQYSKGMARRIGLAQSLINDPDLLILDEPTTGLDPIGTREMKDLILTLRDRGKTILLCSHLLGDVQEVCDRICILYGGRSRAMGTVDGLLAADEFIQIRAPRLSEDAICRIRELIRESAGAQIPVEVEIPRRQLEDYFLDVVEAARTERLSTAGAERGTGTAQFLGAREDEGERLLEELVQAGTEEVPKERPAAEPAALGPVQDSELIEGLTAAGSQEPERKEEPPAATPETVVDRDVLDELIQRGEGSGKQDEE